MRYGLASVGQSSPVRLAAALAFSYNERHETDTGSLPQTNRPAGAGAGRAGRWRMGLQLAAGRSAVD